MTVVVITAPTAKLPMTGDAAVDAAIEAAVAMHDGPGGTLGRAILPQTLEVRMPGWAPRHDVCWDGGDCFGASPCADEHRWRHHGAVELPFPPVAAVEQITYVDQAGATQTLDPSAYVVGIDGDRARVMPALGAAWPAAMLQPDSVRIRYTAGYATVPPGLVLAFTMQGRMLASLAGRDAFLKSEQVTGIGSASYDTGTTGAASTQAAVDVLLAPFRILSL